MITPPDESFGQTLSSLFTPEHLAQMRALQSELDRLKSLSDGWAPRKLAADLKQAQRLSREAPGEDAVNRLAQAMDETDGQHPRHNQAQAHQWKKLRVAARLACWEFYGRQCRPFLLSIFDLVIATIEQAAEVQKVRESDWLIEFEKWQAWAIYYGTPQMPPAVAHVLVRRALDVRRQRALTEERTCDTRGLPDPPHLAATVRAAGLAVADLENRPSAALAADVGGR